MQMTFNIPEWGIKTCVTGTEWKTGEFNGKHYEHTVIYGISRKPVNEGKGEIIVTEQFKIRQKLALKVGEVVNLSFNRFGQVDGVTIEKGGGN